MMSVQCCRQDLTHVDEALLDISDRMAKAERFFPAREHAQTAASATAG